MKTNRNLHPEIIYLPRRQARYQRNLYQLFTTFAWMTWLYLIQPLISLLVWWLGVDTFTDIVLRTDDANIAGTFLAFGMVIAAIAMAIVAWSQFSIWHSRRKIRPANKTLATSKMICELFQVDRDTMEQMHSGKVLVLDINDDQTIRSLTRPAPAEEDQPKVRYA